METAFLKTVFFLSLISIFGFLIYRLILRCLRGDGYEDEGALASLPVFFILGSGVYVFVEMFLSIAGIKSHLSHFFGLFFIAAAANIFSCRRPADKTKSRLKPGLFKALVVILASAFVLVPLLLNLLSAMAFPQFDIDMVAHILIKAKLLLTDSYRSSVFIQDKIFANMHSGYPPFAAIFYNLLFLSGGRSVSCYQIANYFIFLLLGIAVWAYLKRRIPAYQSGIWLFVFMSTSGYISSQFIMDSTDVLLSLSFFLTVSWLSRLKTSKDDFGIFICALLAGISTLIKNDALYFNLIVMALAALWARKDVWKYLMVWGMIALPWIIYRMTLPSPVTGFETMIRAFDLKQSLGTLPEAFAAAFDIILRRWNSFFILWPAALLIAWRSRWRFEAGVFSLFTALLLLAYFFMIWSYIGKIPSYANTFFRILCHFYPMVFIVVALGTAHLLRRKNPRGSTNV